MIKVKVIKLAGETGLRRPGSTYLEENHRAGYLEVRGLVEIIDKEEFPLVKEEKIVFETKEEKLIPETKRKRPRVKPKGR